MAKNPRQETVEAGKRKGRGKGDGELAEGTVDKGFDRWLEERLRKAYSSVLDEPVPDDLIKLIKQKFDE